MNVLSKALRTTPAYLMGWENNLETDTDFIPKVLGIFNLEPQYGYFAMVQSEFNVLFLPYINDELLPIREDGIYPATARNNAKIYPIVEKDNAIRGCNNVGQGNKEIN